MLPPFNQDGTEVVGRSKKKKNVSLDELSPLRESNEQQQQLISPLPSITNEDIPLEGRDDPISIFDEDTTIRRTKARNCSHLAFLVAYVFLTWVSTGFLLWYLWHVVDMYKAMIAVCLYIVGVHRLKWSFKRSMLIVTTEMVIKKNNLKEAEQREKMTLRFFLNVVTFCITIFVLVLYIGCTDNPSYVPKNNSTLGNYSEKYSVSTGSLFIFIELCDTIITVIVFVEAEVWSLLLRSPVFAVKPICFYYTCFSLSVCVLFCIYIAQTKFCDITTFLLWSLYSVSIKKDITKTLSCKYQPREQELSHSTKRNNSQIRSDKLKFSDTILHASVTINILLFTMFNTLTSRDISPDLKIYLPIACIGAMEVIYINDLWRQIYLT